ncbi:Ppx/GppA family phosphatase [Cohnella hongkongensis]|uniref:Ppx/GppA family phosphatase n=1 Tax=Cohnella hongkongensis TaxID=178337 RepID=A0ABV9F5J2_9BACL
MRTTKSRATGIIDIGSNTVRLSVYQLTDNGAYRVVDQGRWSARLSQRVAPDGTLPADAVDELAEVLRHYLRICAKHGAERIRAVATAAIRQAANRESVIQRLRSVAGIDIELLSGEEEARIGSVAMLNSLRFGDGFVVDIGGGSTEMTLIRGRQVVSAASFPIGCVNVSARYGLGDEPVTQETLETIIADTKSRLRREDWISRHPGLPLIGLGGTVRALAKLRQRESGYPFPHLHGYEMSAPDVSAALNDLSRIPVAQRRKRPGLSKDRGDVIVPGLAILLGVMEHIQASGLAVCGAGLRDGLFYETCEPYPLPASDEEVLEESIRNLVALYPAAPGEHLQQVRKLAVALFDQLDAGSQLPRGSRKLLETAARLFRIGATIDYNDCADHTFYMLLHTHWNGLSHRETILTAAIASYRSSSSLRRKLSPYPSVLSEGDLETAGRLGALLLLASTLDRSESQAISSLEIAVEGKKLILYAQSSHPLPVERMEIGNMAKEFKKIWGMTPELRVVRV